MDKIKRYFDVGIGIETCNLKCHYCYIAQRERFAQKIKSINHSKEEIRRALSQKRLGGTCLFNMCAGGETLLSDEILPITKELLEEGHYVMVVTNGTLTKRFQEIAEWSEIIKQRLFIKFSYHFLEMKRLNITDRFFNNVQLMKDSGVSFTVEVTPSDELIPYIDELKKACMDNLGALCHVTIARNELSNDFEILTKLSRDEYVKKWEQFDSELFKYKNSIFGEKRNEFCYAGEWSFHLNLESGNLKQCVYERTIDNIYQNMDRPLNYQVVGHQCRMAHCWNGHSYLGFGVIPELDAPTYAEMRNRVCKDGSEWLTPTMKSFMSTKLYESNREYNWIEKITLKRPIRVFLRDELLNTSVGRFLYRIRSKMKGR